MRKILAVTVGRSDYGILTPILRCIAADPELDLQILIGGMHLSPEFGLTADLVKADGFEIAERIEHLLSADTPAGISKSMGLGVICFAQAFARLSPDILLLTGDRFEMHAAALAALPFRIPVAHIHGGEASMGAIDDALRHCITKLSHIHFVSTHEYARRVCQLGEETWRVTVSGAPALDHLRDLRLLSEPEIERRFGFRLDPRPLLVTFHPATLESETGSIQVAELLASLSDIDVPIIFTATNADAGGRAILSAIRDFVGARENAWLVDNLGAEAYFSLLSLVPALVGNSSSGIIEAPSFRLPVVNIGNRQAGRVRAVNVIDVPCERRAIRAGLDLALSSGFRAGLSAMNNPYVAPDGLPASERIVQVLKRVTLNSELTVKRFADLPQPMAQAVA